MKPSISRAVHYMSRGSKDGVFRPMCRAATVTATYDKAVDEHDIPFPPDVVDLFIMNPDGIFFGHAVHHDEDKKPGTWHWPEWVDE